eukprot:COSAG01_NODE_3391_length_6151_cov_4.717944_11_plen_122_part_00
MTIQRRTHRGNLSHLARGAPAIIIAALLRRRGEKGGDEDEKQHEDEGEAVEEEEEEEEKEEEEEEEGMHGGFSLDAQVRCIIFQDKNAAVDGISRRVYSFRARFSYFVIRPGALADIPLGL